MPAAEIRPSLHDVTLPRLAALKRVWRVSMAALLRCAFDLGTINERRYRFLNMQLAKAGYKLREPLETEFPHEQTRLLQSILSYHRDELQFSIKDLSDFLFMHESELRTTYNLVPPSTTVLRRIK
jgi:Zn-dependent peptidase ImmA (M78 family)